MSDSALEGACLAEMKNGVDFPRRLSIIESRENAAYTVAASQLNH
jgi:hypothetical protein